MLVASKNQGDSANPALQDVGRILVAVIVEMTIGRESVTAVECLGLGVVGIDHDIGPGIADDGIHEGLAEPGAVQTRTDVETFQFQRSRFVKVHPGPGESEDLEKAIND